MEKPQATALAHKYLNNPAFLIKTQIINLKHTK